MKSGDLSLYECSISYSALERSFVSRTLTTTSDTLSTNWRTAHLIRPHKFDEKSSDQIFYFQDVWKYQGEIHTLSYSQN
jgi:hypothetical protein